MSHLKPHYQAAFKRGLWAVLIVGAVTFVGTAGIYFIERWRFIDSFYFMSMIVTAQGPTGEPETDLGKIFTAFMAFVSTGTVVVSLGYISGPFIGGLWKAVHDKVEDEVRNLKKGNPPQA